MAGAAVYLNLKADEADRMKAEFTWSDRFGERYEAFREVGNELHLPRGSCGTAEVDRRVDGMRIDLPLLCQPRSDEQARVCRAASKLLLEGSRSHVIQASTGFGKTYVAANVISKVGRKTLVVVTKTDLMDQWRKELSRFLGLGRDRIGRVQADTCDVAGKPVVLAMLHSISKRGRYKASIYGQFGLVVFDEVHRLPADQFSNAAFAFPARLRLGLSATPQRSDGRDRLIEAHLGPVLVRSELVPMSPRVLRYVTKWRAPRPRGREIPHTATKNMHVIKMLARNAQRNRLVVHLIEACYEKKRNCVVFSHLLEHLNELSVMARVPSTDVGFYVGGKSKTELEAASVKKVVFATYGMLSTGTDCPWWDACILSTPKANVKQAAGRILREHPGKKTPVIFDLHDRGSRLFGGWGGARIRYYRSDACDAEVVEMAYPEEL